MKNLRYLMLLVTLGNLFALGFNIYLGNYLAAVIWVLATLMWGLNTYRAFKA